jgi:hypothetical protein
MEPNLNQTPPPSLPRENLNGRKPETAAHSVGTKWDAQKPKRRKGWRKDQQRWQAHYRNSLDPGEQTALFDIDSPDRLGPISEGLTA